MKAPESPVRAAPVSMAAGQAAAGISGVRGKCGRREGEGSRAFFISCFGSMLKSRYPRQEETMKNKLVEALYSGTLRSFGVVLLMLASAILSACAGGPPHAGGGGE